MTDVLLRDVELDGAITDVYVSDGRVSAIGEGVPATAESVIDAGGGALIPGLNDHHIHLLATAAAAQSVPLGPPSVRSEAEFELALRNAARAVPTGSWIRAVGYHESVAGDLDATGIDRVVRDRLVRIQHRSGAMWMLNGAARDALGMIDPSGRLFCGDDAVRAVAAADPPALDTLGTQLARLGVTGVTDATPSRDITSIELIARAARCGALPQTVEVTGAPTLASHAEPRGVSWGPVKYVITDHELPTFEDTRDAVAIAHASGRPIAIHCVTAVALALALAAWCDAGVLDGDRIEHGSVISAAAAAQIAQLGLTVVTQPGFIAARGDDYRADVEPSELGDLYRCGSLQRLGIRVGGSTDAPFGDIDPWRAMRAAIDRCTSSDVVLGADERVAPERALQLFLTSLGDPGGIPRRVQPGTTADLCLLDSPLAKVLESLSRDHVAATFARGELVFRR